MSPLAIAVHRIHLRERLQGIASIRSVRRVRRGMRRMRCRWAVATIVPRWCTRRRSSPHENRLPWRLVSVYFRLNVLHLRSKDSVGCSGNRRTSGRVARGGTAFERVPTSGASDVDVCRCNVHRRRTGDRTGRVRGTTHATRMSTCLDVVVFR